jgi:hypothetical protein
MTIYYVRIKLRGNQTEALTRRLIEWAAELVKKRFSTAAWTKMFIVYSWRFRSHDSQQR